MPKHIVLIIDDDNLILTTLKKRFSTQNVESFTACTPEEAKQLLAKITPELVILDLLLTKEDGSSGVLDYMKSEERLNQVPVLVLTNLDKPELRNMMLAERNVKEYLIKGSMTLDDLYNKTLGYLEPVGK
ncbi:MAG: response regulator [Patescibacteria group bacterium]|nr:response regulator [Patescibacteria group bacterium]